MIAIPKPPKQPRPKASLSEWTAYLERLKGWVHVYSQVEAYKKHKYAVKEMNLREIGNDGEFRAPKFPRKKRKAAK